MRRSFGVFVASVGIFALAGAGLIPNGARGQSGVVLVDDSAAVLELDEDNRSRQFDVRVFNGSTARQIIELSVDAPSDPDGRPFPGTMSVSPAPPAGVQPSSTFSASVTASLHGDLKPGTYRGRLVVTSDDGTIASKLFTVTVSSATAGNVTEPPDEPSYSPSELVLAQPFGAADVGAALRLETMDGTVSVRVLPNGLASRTDTASPDQSPGTGVAGPSAQPAIGSVDCLSTGGVLPGGTQVLDASSVTVTPAEVTLYPGIPADLRVAVTGLPSPGSFVGCITVMYYRAPDAALGTTTPPPAAAIGSLHIPIVVQSSVAPTLSMGGPESIVVTRTSCPDTFPFLEGVEVLGRIRSVAECALASILVPPIEREDQQLISVLNTGGQPVLMTSAKVSLLGSQIGGSADGVAAEVPAAVDVGQEGMIQLTGLREPRPDTYGGRAIVSFADSDATWVVPLELRLREGPLFAAFGILLGIVLVRRYERVQRRSNELRAASDVLEGLDAKVRGLIPGDRDRLSPGLDALWIAYKGARWGNAEQGSADLIGRQAALFGGIRGLQSQLPPEQADDPYGVVRGYLKTALDNVMSDPSASQQALDAARKAYERVPGLEGRFAAAPGRGLAAGVGSALRGLWTPTAVHRLAFAFRILALLVLVFLGVRWVYVDGAGSYATGLSPEWIALVAVGAVSEGGSKFTEAFVKRLA